MIQRIQSLLLAGAAVFNFSVFFTPLYDRAMEDSAQWVGYAFALILTLAMLLSLFSIFQYANRKNQLSWVKRTMLVQVVALAFGTGITLSLGGVGVYLWDEVLGDVIMAVALVAQYLALYNIKKDQELVKSMDRIR